jgi:hypothetical protein
MTEKQSPLANIDAMSRLVEVTMRRATTSLPDTLIAQAGGMIRYCMRRHLTGNSAHPGIAKMARMAKCSERQAQRNLRVLEAWGVLYAVEYPKGGRWAPRYVADLDALKRTLIALGCNPSRQLVAKMEQAWGDIGGDIWRDKWRDTMSPGIQIKNPTQISWRH